MAPGDRTLLLCLEVRASRAPGFDPSPKSSKLCEVRVRCFLSPRPSTAFEGQFRVELARFGA